MKKYLLVAVLLLLLLTAFSQPKSKQKTQPPTPSEMDKMMEAEMKGMSEADKAEMRKMMKDIMPTLQDNNNKIADYPEFTSNKQLVPKKNAGQTTALPVKKMLQADVSTYASTLFNKIITKGDAAEVALTKKIIAQNPEANAIGGAAVLCMMQGHPQAAMALSMKAVQIDPSNPNWQNNMAALLTQYGYPEQAIPLLQKLKTQFPRNSTVLNNLGQAWLALGEIDSAETNIKRAGGLNPNYPEAKETEGVIEETKGNTDKATDDYIKAMENAVNPFTEILIKNNNGQSKLDKIDFEKLKRTITIYEYFPKDWIKISALSDDVAGYENDMAVKNGYSKMFDTLKSQIDLMAEASGAEVQALMDKGEKEFVETMAKENIKGIGVMSKPAIIVQMILQAYLKTWMEEYVKEGSHLMETINGERIRMTKTGENDKCPDFDRKNNAFLVYANPLIRKFHAEKIEEFRMWLNAFCTWAWYITGNPKNTILTTCIGWTGAITEMYQNAIDNQFAFPKSCVKQNGDGLQNTEIPSIPNFTCPTIVRIPVGADWQQLSNAAKNFDNNSSGTRQNAKNPVPNHSIAYSVDHSAIAEPGRDPFTKTANGSMSPGMINDQELTPLSKIPLDDLTPLPKILSDDLTPLPDLRKSKLANELLKKMMKADCKNVKNSKDILKEALEKMMKGVRELEAYENLIEQIKSLESEIEQKETDAGKKEQLKQQIEKMQQETDKMDKYEDVQASKKEMEKIMKEMDDMDDKKFMKEKFDKITQAVEEMESAPAILKGIQQNGLQTSISSGLQAPGTFTPVKGLFN
jgi:Flp pilus assembly protein TadD